MTEERMIEIFDRSGAYREDAAVYLLSVMVAPEDAAAAHHIRALMRAEEKILETSEVQLPQESPFATSALKPYRKATKATTIAGLVVLGLADLERHRLPVSLSRAIFMTAEFLADAEAKRVVQGYPLSERDIRKHFYAFKNVSRLWAAQLVYPDKFLASTESMFGMADFLSHARTFEGVLQRTLNAQTPRNPWRVPQCVPSADPASLKATKEEYVMAALRYAKSGGA